jgi:hypothetical protein
MDTNQLDRLRETMRARAETIRSQKAGATELREHAEEIIVKAREARSIAATTRATIGLSGGGRREGAWPGD